MVIIADKVGQLCNRLFHFSFFIANSIDNGYKLINPCFDEYAEYFEVTAANNYLGYPIRNKITPFKLLDKIILKYYSKAVSLSSKFVNLDIRNATTNYDLKGSEYQKIAKNKIVFAKGWLFKDHDNLRKHRNVLVDIFKPKAIYYNEASEIILKLREKFNCVIGVHVRRGDYKTWRDGKYYFSDEIYLQKMLQLQEELKLQNKSCCFFISSNEPLNEDAFQSVNNAIGERHFIVDLYSLANCDYIIGPHSTFSLWGAYYGNVPFLIIESETTEVALSKFSYF